MAQDYESNFWIPLPQGDIDCRHKHVVPRSG